MAVVITQEIVDDADDYFATRVNALGWTSSDNQEKLEALVTAGNLLASMDWAGYPVSNLAPFPRYLPGSVTPQTPVRMLWALYEQAIHLRNNPDLMTEEEGLETLVVGPIQLQNFKPVELIPKIVKRYIGPYTQSNGGYGGATWWRAN